MRVATGYTNGYTAGKMTSGGTDYYGTAFVPPRSSVFIVQQYNFPYFPDGFPAGI